MIGRWRKDTVKEKGSKLVRKSRVERWMERIWCGDKNEGKVKVKGKREMKRTGSALAEAWAGHPRQEMMKDDNQQITEALLSTFSTPRTEHCLA